MLAYAYACFFHALKSFLEIYLLYLMHLHFLVDGSQDPLEKFFGLQRQRGRVSENPSMQEFLRNTQALRVIKMASISVKGNCREDATIDENECCPIKRKGDWASKMDIHFPTLLHHNL